MNIKFPLKSLFAIKATMLMHIIKLAKYLISDFFNSMYFVLLINIPKYTIDPWNKKLWMLKIWNAGYIGSDVDGYIINTTPPIIEPVAKQTSPTLFNVPFANELSNPAYNKILQ